MLEFNIFKCAIHFRLRIDGFEFVSFTFVSLTFCHLDRVEFNLSSNKGCTTHIFLRLLQLASAEKFKTNGFYLNLWKGVMIVIPYLNVVDHMRKCVYYIFKALKN